MFLVDVFMGVMSLGKFGLCGVVELRNCEISNKK